MCESCYKAPASAPFIEIGFLDNIIHKPVPVVPRPRSFRSPSSHEHQWYFLLQVCLRVRSD